MPILLVAIILPIVAIFIVYKLIKFFYLGVKNYEENKKEDKEWAKLQESSLPESDKD